MRLVRRSVDDVLDAGAGQGADLHRSEVQFAELMATGIGKEQTVAGEFEIPDRSQGCFTPRAGLGFERPAATAGAGERDDVPRIQVDPADRVIAGIGNVDDVFAADQPLW